MKIARERPSQRLHHRVVAPIYVEIGGAVCPATDWSLGGLRIDDYQGELPSPGDCLDCSLSLPFQGFSVSFEARTEVVRCDPATNSFAASFQSIGEREKGLMAHFIDGLVRGSMVPLQDTIQRIDVPVTPVPTTPDPNPSNQIPLRRWPIKTIVISLTYIILGVLIFGYLVLAGYFALFRLEVDSAVVVSERQAMTSPARGRIIELLGLEGAVVEEGAVLAVLTDHDLAKRKSEAQSRLRDALAAHEEALNLLAEEEKRAEGYQLIGDNNIAQAKVQIEMLAVQHATLVNRVTRLQHVFDKGWATRERLERAELALAEVASTLMRKRIHMQEMERLRSLGAGRRLYDGARFVGELAALEAATIRSAADVDSVRVLLREIEGQEAELAVVAPWRARVMSFERKLGDNVRIGENILVIERLGQSKIAAYLSQEEVATIREGDRARVYFPSRDSWRDARVSVVDRTDGFFDVIKMDYRSRAREARSAKVMLDVLGEVPRSGAPAVVVFERRPDNSVFNLIDSWLEQR